MRIYKLFFTFRSHLEAPSLRDEPYLLEAQGFPHGKRGSVRCSLQIQSRVNSRLTLVDEIENARAVSQPGCICHI